MPTCKKIILLTDEELNKQLAINLKLAPRGKVLSFYQRPKFDFCANWNLLMPLVVANSICYVDRNDGRRGRFLAQHSFQNDRKPPYHEGNSNWTYIESVNDNLQRALAECLLLILTEQEH